MNGRSPRAPFALGIPGMKKITGYETISTDRNSSVNTIFQAGLDLGSLNGAASGDFGSKSLANGIGGQDAISESVIKAADDAVREYLAFRSMTGALRAFESDIRGLENTVEGELRAQKLAELLLSYTETGDVEGLKHMWRQLDRRLFLRLDRRLQTAARYLHDGLIKLLLVQCIKQGRMDKVHGVFNTLSSELVKNPDWRDWFALPFLKDPERQPAFQTFFSADWHESFAASLENFIDAALAEMPVPGLVRLLDGSVFSNLLQQQQQLAESEDTHELGQEKRLTKLGTSEISPDQLSSSAPNTPRKSSKGENDPNGTRPEVSRAHRDSPSRLGPISHSPSSAGAANMAASYFSFVQGIENIASLMAKAAHRPGEYGVSRQNVADESDMMMNISGGQEMSNLDPYESPPRQQTSGQPRSYERGPVSPLDALNNAMNDDLRDQTPSSPGDLGDPPKRSPNRLFPKHQHKRSISRDFPGGIATPETGHRLSTSGAEDLSAEIKKPSGSPIDEVADILENLPGDATLTAGGVPLKGVQQSPMLHPLRGAVVTRMVSDGIEDLPPPRSVSLPIDSSQVPQTDSSSMYQCATSGSVTNWTATGNGSGGRQSSIGVSADDDDSAFIVVSSRCYRGHAGGGAPIFCSSGSAGNVVVSSDLSGTVKVWRPNKLPSYAVEQEANVADTPTSETSSSSTSNVVASADRMSSKATLLSLRGYEWPVLAADLVGSAENVLLVSGKRCKIEVYDVNLSKRTFEFSTSSKFPYVHSIATPGNAGNSISSGSIFVTAATNSLRNLSLGHRTSNNGDERCELQLWNMRSMKSEGTLAYGESGSGMSTGSRSSTNSKGGAAVQALQFNHNGKLLAVATADCMLRILDVVNRQELMGWNIGRESIVTVHFSFDERSIHTVNVKGQYQRWDLIQAGAEVAEGAGFTVTPWFSSDEQVPVTGCCAIDSFGRYLLAASPTGYIPIYSVVDRRAVQILGGHSDAITCLDYNTSARGLLSASRDGSVRITRLESFT
eukprot:Clim_evm42s215 gene=Clim_evmTU42s215